MAMKEQQRSVYKTMQGKEIDMHKLVMQNEMAVAVGNVKVNARGDELGPGGKIIRKREDVLRASNMPEQKSVRHTPEAPVVVEKSAPISKSRKNIEDMDPEGNE